MGPACRSARDERAYELPAGIVHGMEVPPCADGFDQEQATPAFGVTWGRAGDGEPLCGG